MKEEAETNVIFLRSFIKCFVLQYSYMYEMALPRKIPKGLLSWRRKHQIPISKHHQCAFVIRTGDSGTAGRHRTKQMVAYPVKPSGRSKEKRGENCPYWAGVPGAFCFNEGCGFFPFTIEFKWVTSISIVLPIWNRRQMSTSSWS